MPTVRIPTQLRTLSGGAAEVSVGGRTVGEVLAAQGLGSGTVVLAQHQQLWVARQQDRFRAAVHRAGRARRSPSPPGAGSRRSRQWPGAQWR